MNKSSSSSSSSSTYTRSQLAVFYCSDDYLNTKKRNTIDLSNTQLTEEVLNILKENSDCKTVTHLNINEMGLTLPKLRALTCFTNLTSLSIRNIPLPLSKDVGTILSNYTRLTELDISYCTVTAEALEILANKCTMVHTLLAINCPGLTSICLTRISNWITQSKRLIDLNLSENSAFDDEGVLSLLIHTSSIIKSIDLSNCPRLTSLCMTAFDSTPTHTTKYKLTKLQVSGLLASGPSPFLWVRYTVYTQYTLYIAYNVHPICAYMLYIIYTSTYYILYHLHTYILTYYILYYTYILYTISYTIYRYAPKTPPLI